MIGTLTIPGAIHVRTNGKIAYGTLKVKLDFSNKRVVESAFGQMPISSSEALTLLFVVAVGYSHPHLHAHSNWGINPNFGENTFLKKMALWTIKYSNYGAHNFQVSTNTKNTITL